MLPHILRYGGDRMSEYKRFVSYIYAYTNDEKGNNTGFAKVEIRSGKKRISLSMRGIGGAPVMHVCGFYRKEERLMCVPLGRMVLAGGAGQFQYGMDGEWIPGSRVPFEELAGIVISAPDSSGNTYATVWDDGPFRLSMFAAEENKPTEQEQGSRESVEQEAVSDVAAAGPTASDGPENRDDREQSHLGEDALGDTQAEVFGDAKSEEKTSGPDEGDLLHSAQVEEEAEEGEQETSGFWKKMCRIYPRITPFSYENHMECLKVKPGDIGRLPRQNWIFGNNSFLLHGYFQYRYLIFGKITEAEAGGYVIGVPGTYSSNEKFLAGMFGFYDFKPVQEGSVTPGTFGYWCTPMEGPRE